MDETYTHTIMYQFSVCLFVSILICLNARNTSKCSASADEALERVPTGPVCDYASPVGEDGQVFILYWGSKMPF